MIATVFARIVPPPVDGWMSSGFDLPRFVLCTESDDRIPGNPNGFTTCEQAATIACEVALYGRPVGTIANLTVIGEGEAFQRFYRVNDGGTLSSVPTSDLDVNGFPLAFTPGATR